MKSVSRLIDRNLGFFFNKGNGLKNHYSLYRCQLQAVLRLELCRQPEQQEDEEVVEQRVEDVRRR